MKPVHVCVPTLRRYDLLERMFQSLRESTIKPAMIYVIDNGRNHERVMKAVEAMPDCRGEVITPSRPLGVAESWNWFLRNVPEERLITNDDVMFAPQSIELMVNTPGDLVWAKGLGFSCYLLRDRCIRVVGLFDETISPGYAYYEDEDYHVRMFVHRDKVTWSDVACGVIHERSSTIALNNPQEAEEHHRKFRIAQGNFMKKWGAMPGEVRERLQQVEVPK